MSIWTTPEDIKAVWINPKTPPSDAKLESLIGYIEDQIIDFFGSETEVNNLIASGDLSLTKIKRLTVNKVISYALTEGSPWTQESQAITGVGSGSRSLSTENALMGLNISEDDLDGCRITERSAAGSASMIGNHWRGRHGDWFDFWGWGC